MKKFYQKYINWIVIVLFCLYGLKSCQSCSRQRTIDYSKSKFEIIEDSLQSEISKLKDTIRYQKDTIKIYKFQLSIIGENNKMLKEANKYFQTTNNTLVNTNKELSLNKIEQ